VAAKTVRSRVAGTLLIPEEILSMGTIRWKILSGRPVAFDP
jgi:hypothetical protein